MIFLSDSVGEAEKFRFGKFAKGQGAFRSKEHSFAVFRKALLLLFSVYISCTPDHCHMKELGSLLLCPGNDCDDAAVLK